MAKLIFGTGSNQIVHTFTKHVTLLGRGRENDIVLQQPAVSLRHCLIKVNGPEVIIKDLESANGTQVNGKLIRNGQMQVKSGQVVKFGNVEARLELDESDRDWTAGDPPSEVAMRLLAAKKWPAVPEVVQNYAETEDPPGEQTIILASSQPPEDPQGKPTPFQAKNRGRALKWLLLSTLLAGFLLALFLKFF